MYIHRIHPLLAPAGKQPGDWGGTTARLAPLFTLAAGEQPRGRRRCSRGPRVNNGVGDAVVHSSRGRDKGCDGGWGWRGGQAGVDRCVVEANKFWPFVEGRLLGTRSSREYVGISITRNLTHLYYAGS